MVQPSDHYPLLLLQVGSDGVEGRSPKTIKQDFRVLGHLAKGVGAQIVLSVLSVPGMNTVRNRKISLINTWLRGWCHSWKSGGFWPWGSLQGTRPADDKLGPPVSEK